MDAQSIYEQLLALFPFEPTDDQRSAFWTFARFLVADIPRAALILRGAAGTGKTTMMQALVDTLLVLDRDCVLLAPTGRAAKVIAGKVGQTAFTIHKHIYKATTDSGGGVKFKRRANDDPENTLYIVDEASMLSHQRTYDSFSSGDSLLDELVRYVYEEDNGSRLLLIGDPVQLPPVGLETSPALDPKFMRDRFDLKIKAIDLKQVKRQALQSGVLLNANRMREAFPTIETQFPRLALRKDFQYLANQGEVVELYQDLYRPDSLDKVVVVTVSNAAAVRINQAIRNAIHYQPETVESGDLVMVVKNYYQDYKSEIPFIANGEMGFIRSVSNRSAEHLFGFDWLEVEVEFRDLLDEPYLESAKIPVNLLNMKEPALSGEHLKTIWHERTNALAEQNEKKNNKTELRKDPYINALQLKYGYAITAHKAQGGQWENVIVVFEPYVTQKMMETERQTLLRWAYTSITRAQKKVYLLNAPFEASDDKMD